MRLGFWSAAGLCHIFVFNPLIVWARRATSSCRSAENLRSIKPNLATDLMPHTVRSSLGFEMCCRLQVRPIGVPTEVEWRQVNESSIEIRWKQVKEDEFRGPPLGYRVRVFGVTV